MINWSEAYTDRLEESQLFKKNVKLPKTSHKTVLLGEGEREREGREQIVR